LEFHESVRPTALALVPTRNAFLVTDGATHGCKYAIPQIRERMGWLEWLLWMVGLGRDCSYPFAYLHATDGGLLRTLEFVDREALSRGAAESLDAHIAFTFFQGPGLEVWDHTLDLKMTYHELSHKPSTPVFDTDGLLWVPYAVGDRQGELGLQAIALWAYQRDGTAWEVFYRRQLGIANPSAVHFDSTGRMALAGLAVWVGRGGGAREPTAPSKAKEEEEEEEDGEREGEGEFAPGTAPCRLDFYTLSGDRALPQFAAEQRARWRESTGASPAPGQAEASIPLSAVPLREASFDFPFPTCQSPLFALTGDGHALTACRGSSSLRIVRFGYPVGADAAARAELAQALAAAESLPEKKRVREAWAPPLSPPGAAAIRLLPSNSSHLRADLASPWGIQDIGGISMDPSGLSFVILDSGSTPARLLVIPWPWDDLLSEEEFGGVPFAVGEVPIDTQMVLTVPPPQPAGIITSLSEPPRSS